MSDLLTALNSGAMHEKARQARPECVDAQGNIHATPERARFVDWYAERRAEWGDSPANWTCKQRAEYERRYAPASNQDRTGNRDGST